VALVLALLAVRPSGRLTAQDSQFGIRGLGTPGKWESVRARSTGGGFAPFDPFSSLTDAALIDMRRMSGSVTGALSRRTVDIGGTQTPLRGTRFPVFVVGGPIGCRIVIGGGFSTYLDRTFGVSTIDTIVVRGDTVPVRDTVTSDGAVADVRVAVAGRINRWLSLGAGFHLLTGSTRVVATRTFGDTAYRSTTARDQVSYSGEGGSVSALLDLTSSLRLAGWFRADSKLASKIRGKTVAENDLRTRTRRHPLASRDSSLSPATRARTGPTPPLNGHNTFNWSVRYGAWDTGCRIPARARGGQMPFGAAPEAPTEFGISAGLGNSSRLDAVGSISASSVWSARDWLCTSRCGRSCWG
jgi:hypothetical protein